MNIYESQFLCPTAFNNGISVGEYNVEGELTTGLPAGLVQPYMVSPTAAEITFLSGTVPGNSTTYVPLSSLENASTTLFVLENDGLKLDCERSISFKLVKPGSILFSGYDRYGQKQTWGNSLTDDDFHDTTRAFSKLTSVQIVNTDNTPSDFTIKTNYTVGLPYNSFDGITPLSVAMESINEDFNIWLYESLAPGNAVVNFFTYFPTFAQDLSVGNPRPLINVLPGAFSNYYDFNGLDILTVWQLVYGAGTVPHWMQSDAEAYARNINSLEAVIGNPPYKEGWIGYQG